MYGERGQRVTKPAGGKFFGGKFFGGKFFGGKSFTYQFLNPSLRRDDL